MATWVIIGIVAEHTLWAGNIKKIKKEGKQNYHNRACFEAPTMCDCFSYVQETESEPNVTNAEAENV